MDTAHVSVSLNFLRIWSICVARVLVSGQREGAIMQKLRLRIIKKRTPAYQPAVSNTHQKSGWQVRKRIHSLLGSDILPLVIAPAIFLIFTGLAWGHWYSEMPIPSPVLLTIVALALGVYCFYRLFSHKRYQNKRFVVR